MHAVFTMASGFRKKLQEYVPDRLVGRAAGAERPPEFFRRLSGMYAFNIFLYNHDSELITACALVREFGQIVREKLALQFCPSTFFKNPVLGLRLMKQAITRPHSELIEVTVEGIARRNLIGYGFLMRVQQFAALTGNWIWHPDAWSVVGQENARHAYRCHLVIVSIGFGVVADVAAFHHDRAQAQAQQWAVNLEAVGGCLH